MKKILLAVASLASLFAIAQIGQPILTEKKNVIKIKPIAEAAKPPAFSAYVSCWAFNKPCNTNKLWLISAENILKKEGLQIFDAARDNNISVAGYNADKRVLVTVICTAAPDGRTTLVLNVFSDDGNVNKTMGELFRQKFQGVTMIDCG